LFLRLLSFFPLQGAPFFLPGPFSFLPASFFPPLLSRLPISSSRPLSSHFNFQCPPPDHTFWRAFCWFCLLAPLLHSPPFSHLLNLYLQRCLFRPPDFSSFFFNAVLVGKAVCRFYKLPPQLFSGLLPSLFSHPPVGSSFPNCVVSVSLSHLPPLLFLPFVSLSTCFSRGLVPS